MRIPRVYCSEPLNGRQQVLLAEESSHYLLKVLRLQLGRPLILFDGRGGEYAAELLDVGKKALVKLYDFKSENRQSPLALTLAVGISRGERFEWVIQKATELGVECIQPLFSERCEVKLSAQRLQKKLPHWQQIVNSACEQSGRNRVPQVFAPKKLSQLLAASDEADDNLKLVLHHRAEVKLQQLEQAYGRPESVLLLVGPEGGLSNAEIGAALSSNFVPICLGPRVLRTETAPLAALSVLQYLWGDF
ncbi:MAG: 16S rRNA (uracil(1498)-N(3))-methyltransferase [Gammaproteobacteria bacterium]|nr:16S rRNA (uracil(1498)-N(3))-methyltransferase [Gammaproteobacteria bacterium]